ncbi:MAG: carbohydrate-binding domain-containing protein [Chloroflexota bacterium]
MKKITTLLITLLLLVTFTACSAAGGTITSTQVSGTTTSSQVLGTTATSTPVVTAASSAAVALAENSQLHGDAKDYAWDPSTEVAIRLNGDSISADGAGVRVNGGTATITAAGTYRLSGSLADGQIIVDIQDEALVRLIFDGVDLRSSTSAPVYIASAEETVIILADNTENYVSDGAAYIFEDSEEDEPNAAIFSKGDLTIYGDGSLTVNGNYNDGIASIDGLIIASGTVTVNSVDDGIRGKDYLVVEDGNITVDAQGDGLKSDNEEDETKGFISIETGVFHITSGGDAIQAQTDVLVASGEFYLSSGGGSNNRIDESTSAKGIKAAVNVNIDGGNFTIDSADDAIHSNGSLVVNGGAFSLSTGDDGMHSDGTLEVNGGDFEITKSYEGIESAVITINAGNIHIVSSDDGLNVVGGNDGSGAPGMGPGGGGRQRPGGGMPGGGPGQDTFTYTGNYWLYIHGGYIVIEAAGDGLDINGAVEMTDGVLLVNGPIEQMNGPLDYDGTFNISGGFLAAVGSSGMAQSPGASSSQNSLLINFDSTQPAGSLVHIQNSAREDILTFAPTKQYQSVAFSSPELVMGESYEVYLGGNATGTATDGWYRDGAYVPGSLYTSFTVSSVVTTIGNSGGRWRP